jgi:hypothetical protein
LDPRPPAPISASTTRREGAESPAPEAARATVVDEAALAATVAAEPARNWRRERDKVLMGGTIYAINPHPNPLTKY